jgi:hypothetical protein
MFKCRYNTKSVAIICKGL